MRPARIRRTPPRNDMEVAAERYIKSRPDWEQLLCDTYTREYVLDIRSLEAAVEKRERFLQKLEDLKSLQGGIPSTALRDALDRLLDSGLQEKEEGDAAEAVIAEMDVRPKEMIDALNQMLQVWATDPGDESYEDFMLPQFRVRNAERYGRQIGAISLPEDGERLVQVSGTLLFLSDPVEIEFVRMAYLCQECSEYTVTDGEKPESCDHCGGRRLRFDPDSELTLTRNFQEAILQENVEDLAGSAASMRMHFFGREINRFSPGDRITVCGFVKSFRVPMKSTRTYLLEAISAWKTEHSSVEVSEEDRRRIMEMASDPHVLDRLSTMIAPEIIGRDDEKRAMILQAVGGVEKRRSSFTERGRIHILFAGDPGMGKSQLLISQKVLSEKSYYISDTSKAGITAAVTDVGNRRVMVPGILVLANGGVACIDELDKMQKEDREGLHTAMEQGIISKSKAGIRAVFKANTSVLAAANPVYGRFDLNSDIPDQLKIEPTLMDRFDLVFWFVSESLDEEASLREAMRILDPPKGEDVTILKKFVKLAAANEPSLSPPAMEAVARAWRELKRRSSNPESIGVRHLQAMRRLSEASAKVRFSREVEDVDVETAFSLMLRSVSPLGGDMDRLRGFGNGIGDMMRRLLDLAKEKGGTLSLEELDNWADYRGFSRQEVQNALAALKREGQVYESRDGMLRVVA